VTGRRNSQLSFACAIILCLATSLSAQESTGPEQERPIVIESGGARRVFVRMEDPAQTSVTLHNVADVSVSKLSATIEIQGRQRIVELDELAAGSHHTISISVDTQQRPGDYLLLVGVQAQYDTQTTRTSFERELTIVPRRIPRMPVLMWGGGDAETLAAIGFTHKLIWLHDYRQIWDAGEPTTSVSDEAYASNVEMLDDLVAKGLGGAVYLYPGRWVMRDDELAMTYGRVERAGESHGSAGPAIDRSNVCANFSEVRDFGYNVGASVARTFGDHPGLQASLVHSEIRDATQLCFHEHDVESYAQATGAQIPATAQSKSGVRYDAIASFPSDRVVADDNPLLKYYQWFWREGDGWNGLHTRVHEGLKSTGRDDLWTFFDPAVRVPSIWGSGGQVDVVSQWTYSYPDPIKIGQAADELFAMAAGNPGQQVMKMTQVIWYRSQTAPDLPEHEADYTDWEQELPDARFITIAPDHMREAFWSKLSRPIKGIMYHGWGSLVGAEHGSYRYTNPQTREVLSELTRDVIRPLGPTLLQVPDRVARVGLLESFASQIFANRGTHGWSGTWEADMHLILQWAQLQPKILYEEQILLDGLDGLDVLVLPSCDVLTESVATAIAAFQSRGGILVADENLAPRLIPDILVESRRRGGRPDQDKAALQAKALELRAQLDPYFERYGESDNSEVVVRFRQAGTSDYLFALNDHRTYGDYVGHHGRVMEKGLPSAAQFTVRRAHGAVYDLVTNKGVDTQLTDDGISFGSSFGPGDGAVFLIIDEPIEGVILEAPSSARRGESLTMLVRIKDVTGRNVDAVVPVEVEVFDARGKRAEFSGYYGAADGLLEIEIDLATNDEVGEWTLSVRELASGQIATRALTVDP
jgi:hypothetical protein